MSQDYIKKLDTIFSAASNFTLLAFLSIKIVTKDLSDCDVSSRSKVKTGDYFRPHCTTTEWCVPLGKEDGMKEQTTENKTKM